MEMDLIICINKQYYLLLIETTGFESMMNVIN